MSRYNLYTLWRAGLFPFSIIFIYVFRVKLMNKMIEFNEVYFEYKSHSVEQPSVKAINGITEQIREGDFVVILGRNGSGKSTLARLMNALLLPVRGTVVVSGMQTTEEGMIWDIRKALGMVFQNPDNQIVATTIEEDLAFGPENLGIEPSEIRKRIDASIKYVGMERYMHHSPHMLSGGQKQRIAIAGILAMEPRCIVLDESTSMLDPRGRREVMDLIKTLNHDKKITIILITHHMDEAVHADSVFVMEDGKISMKGSPRQIFGKVEELKDAGLDVPQVTALMQGLKSRGLILDETCLTIDEAAQSIISILSSNQILHVKTDIPREILSAQPAEREVIARVTDLTHTYMPGTAYEQKALDHISFEIYKGEILGVIGHTGSGKSTLVQHLNGILKPTSGSLEVAGLKADGKALKELRQKVGLIFQYPEQQLFEETVYKDIIFGLNRMGLSSEETERRVKHVMQVLELPDNVLEKSPFELSGGQKRRVAIAGVLVMEPKILILDEPTAGLDPRGSREVFSILSELNRLSGTTIIIISHNMDDIAAFCSRVAVLNKGRLEMMGTPKEVFSDVNRLKEFDLDIPRIAELFRNLALEGYSFEESILTVPQAEDAIIHRISSHITEPGGGLI